MSSTPEHFQRCSSLCCSALFLLEAYADACCASLALRQQSVVLICFIELHIPSKEILRR